MSPIDVVKTFITALQSGDMEEAANRMSDDFVEKGWTPQPLDGQQFLALLSALRNAMPDFSFNLSDVRERGNEVEALIAVSGNHTRDLALPEYGLPLIPYSGVAIYLTQTYSEYRVKDNKVAEMLVETMPGGGLAGLLQQVDTDLPILPRVGHEDIKRMNESGEEQL
ncbi:MAG TPA: nuclear transport factor 2 family protein [Ktedonobacteraceae bacterium]|nr:nuclear transport factor 2 family protein [Ktedonobacteraceae bacterium]